jgi:hypothetical protein
MGHPQSRIIADSLGNKTAVSTSEYAKFAHFYLPGANKDGIDQCPNYVGEIVGILGFYSDNATYDPAPDDWSITIRTVNDLRLYHKETKEHWLYDSNGNVKPGSEYSE